MEFLTVELSESGWRLDLFLAHHFPNYSRTHVRNAIVDGYVLIREADDPAQETHGKPSFRLKPGQIVAFEPPEVPREAPIPEEIPLDILFEDEDLLVVNKPPDMVVHPSRGHWSGTLVGALAFHFAGKLSTVRGPSRPGIVHRLDRDTSGAILVAKNDVIHAKLAALFEEKRIQKEYFAIVIGCPVLDRDMIDMPIGLHTKYREKMAIRRDDPDAKEAQTFYEVIKRYHGFSTIRAMPQTGRTHQIRIHMTYAGFPVLCDRLYGGRSLITVEELQGKKPIALTEDATEGTVILRRQALHAHRLSFTHPGTGKSLEITAPIPQDMQAVVEVLENCRAIR
ncbi:MAG: RluA family pseudouridine synthase [Planctomycetaceae bacterium]|nr:RluA family pseudouridine synthase [Planctomycetaceae bacterium]